MKTTKHDPKTMVELIKDGVDIAKSDAVTKVRLQTNTLQGEETALSIVTAFYNQVLIFIHMLEGLVSDMVSDIHDLMVENRDYRNKCESLEGDLVKVNDDRMMQNLDNAKVIKRHVDAIQGLKQEVVKLGNDNSAYIKMLEVQKQQSTTKPFQRIKEHLSTIRRLEKDNVALAERLSGQKDYSEKLAIRCCKRDRSIREQTETIRRGEKRIAELKADLSISDTRCLDLSHNIENLNTELKEKNAEIDTLRADLTETTDALEGAVKRAESDELTHIQKELELVRFQLEFFKDSHTKMVDSLRKIMVRKGCVTKNEIRAIFTQHCNGQIHCNKLMTRQVVDYKAVTYMLRGSLCGMHKELCHSKGGTINKYDTIDTLNGIIRRIPSPSFGHTVLYTAIGDGVHHRDCNCDECSL